MIRLEPVKIEAYDDELGDHVFTVECFDACSATVKLAQSCHGKKWPKRLLKRKAVGIEMTEPKPCPFCGHVGVDIVETSTFRWRAAQCRACGVIGPEVRIKTVGDGTKAEWEADAAEKAIEEWNTRA